MWIPVGWHLGPSAFLSDESRDYNMQIRQLGKAIIRRVTVGGGGYFRPVGGLPGFSPHAWGAVTQGYEPFSAALGMIPGP